MEYEAILITRFISDRRQLIVIQARHTNYTRYIVQSILSREDAAYSCHVSCQIFIFPRAILVEVIRRNVLHVTATAIRRASPALCRRPRRAIFI